jgi:hypothetical protein
LTCVELRADQDKKKRKTIDREPFVFFIKRDGGKRGTRHRMVVVPPVISATGNGGVRVSLLRKNTETRRLPLTWRYPFHQVGLFQHCPLIEAFLPCLAFAIVIAA